MNVFKRLTAEVATLRGALRTLKMTTPIARNPRRVFPQVVLELADKYGDAPALLSDGECFVPKAVVEEAPTPTQNFDSCFFADIFEAADEQAAQEGMDEQGGAFA